MIFFRIFATCKSITKNDKTTKRHRIHTFWHLPKQLSNG